MKKVFLLIVLSCFTLSAYAQSGHGNSMAVNQSVMTVKKMTISPNPAQSDVKIILDENTPRVKSISVFSIIGSQVMSESVNSSAKVIDLNVGNLKKGKYIVRVIFEDNTSEVSALMKQ